MIAETYMVSRKYTWIDFFRIESLNTIRNKKVIEMTSIEIQIELN